MKANMVKAKRGSALVLAVIMVVILLIIGLALIKLGMNARLLAIHSQLVITARTAADAGMTAAIKAMRKKFADEFIWNNASLPSATNVSVPGMPATYTYTVVGSPATGWNVSSSGTATSNVQRTVHTRLKITPFPAIAVKNEIWVQKSDFSCGAITMQTNSTSADAIKLKAGVTISGDVVCGPGSDPAQVIDTKATTVITGFCYAAEEPVPFPSVTIPPPDWTVPKTAYNVATDVTVTGDRWWGATRIDANDLNIIGPTRILIEGGDLTLANDMSIIVKPGASLELWLDGNFEGKNSMGLENQTNDATKLKINGTVNCTVVNLKAKSASLACAIYAPSADVTLFNSANIVGTVAANNFKMDMGGSFCPDANSGRSTIDPSQGSWWEE